MAAIATSDTGKAIMQDAAIQVSVNHLPDIGAEKAAFFGKMIFVNLFQGLKMIFHALIILGLLRPAWPIDWNGFGHERCSLIRDRSIPKHLYCK